MKIAVFIKRTTLHNGFGGLEVQNKILCEGLSALGHEVYVFSPKMELEDSTLHFGGVFYKFIDSDTRKFLAVINKKSWYIKSRKEFEFEHSIKPFDLIVSQSSAGVSLLNNKSKYRIPNLVISHGTALGELETYFSNSVTQLLHPRTLLNIQYFLRQYLWMQPLMIRQADVVVAVSPQVKESLIKETGVKKEKVEVILNGVAVSSAITRSTQITNSIVFFGQLIKEKGTEDLCQLMLDPKLEGQKFIIMGDGPELHKIKDLVAVNKLEKRVLVTGKIPYKEILEKLGSLYGSILLFPTHRKEGLPMTLVEASIHGLIAVAYDMGGVSRAIIDNKTGVLVKSGSYNELRDHLVNLLKDSSRRVIMASSAVEYARENFTAERMVQNYVKVINKICNL